MSTSFPPQKKKVINCIVITVLIAGVLHVATSQAYFRKTEDKLKYVYTGVTEGRKIFVQNPGLCFSGAMPLTTSYGSLFQDVSCANRPGATPMYIHSNEKTGVWLSSVLYSNKISRMTPTLMFPALKLPGNGGWVNSIAIPYGHDVQFTANKVGNLSIALSDQTGMQQSITIERNFLKKSVQKAVWESAALDEASLDRDSSANVITYKLGFTKEQILLFADGRWIADLPLPPQGTNSLSLVLRTTDNKPADIGGLLISERPSMGNLQIFPRINLVKK